MPENTSFAITPGATFLLNDETVRVLDVRQGCVLVISETTNRSKELLLSEFIGCIQTRVDDMRSISETQSIVGDFIDIPDKELETIQKEKEVYDSIFFDHRPHIDRIIGKYCQSRCFDEAAKELGVSKRTVRRRFKKYVLSGRHFGSLIDKRHDPAPAKKRHIVHRLGRHYADGTVNEIVTDEETEKMLATIWILFHKNGYNITRAYEEVIAEPIHTYIEENGIVNMIDVPRTKFLTLAQARYYCRKRMNGLTVQQYKNGPIQLVNNHRVLTGNSQTGVSRVGQIFQTDACELDVYLVDAKTRSKVVGKPILYLLIDVYSQIIVGASVHLMNNSVDGFCDAFLSMLTDHNEQTKPYGVTCTQETFPSRIKPDFFLVDQGSDFVSEAFRQGCRSTFITETFCPAGVASLKGLVENAFERIQHALAPILHMKGGVNHYDPHQTKTAQKTACLTIDDIRTLAYREIIACNTRSMSGLCLTADQKENNVHSPSDLYRYYAENEFDPVNITPERAMSLAFGFMSKKRCLIWTRAGIVWAGKHDLIYFIDNDWFKKIVLDKAKQKKAKIRVDERDVSFVYMNYDNRIYKIPLSAGREQLESYKGMSWNDVDELDKAYYENRSKQEWKDSVERAMRSREERLIVAKAKALKDMGQENDRKDMKKTHKEEISDISGREDEIRVKMLGSVPVPGDEPSKPEDLPAKKAPKPVPSPKPKPKAELTPDQIEDSINASILDAFGD